MAYALYILILFGQQLHPYIPEISSPPRIKCQPWWGCKYILLEDGQKWSLYAKMVKNPRNTPQLSRPIRRLSSIASTSICSLTETPCL
jgi:hypothetical protein